MKIWVEPADPAQPELGRAVARLVAQLSELGFHAEATVGRRPGRAADGVCIELIPDEFWRSDDRFQLVPEGDETLLERSLSLVPLDFDTLPLLVEGESKVVRLWTDQTVVSYFKPTVYSYTTNRYGEAPGTGDSRVKFSAALFREMAVAARPGGRDLRTAFLAEIVAPDRRLLVERRVERCNLETRVKRYHIGSPLHRYHYTERFPSTQRGGPITRWSRFDEPVVCFDWRHPLHDDQGNRLADEPISDDYARVWMYNVDDAKRLARQTFLWMEQRFAAVGVRLIDVCLLIDRAGRTIYGEISPDCMRVQLSLGDPALVEPGAKDVWRAGGSADDVLRNYEEVYRRLFETDARKEWLQRWSRTLQESRGEESYRRA